MTSPTTAPPEGYEIISPDTLRKYGVPKDAKYRSPADDNWNPLLGNFTGERLEEWAHLTVFIAPLGTTAALSTPLPEAGECNCGAMLPCEDRTWECHVSCPAHPRNRLVRVLPGQLAELKERPEGLMWANKDQQDWTLYPYQLQNLKDDADNQAVAYALPQWSYDEAMGRGEKKACHYCDGTGWQEEVNPHKRGGERPCHRCNGTGKISTQPESEVKTCALPNSTNLDASAKPASLVETSMKTGASNAAPETSEQFRAAATPSAEEMLDWIEENGVPEKQWRTTSGTPKHPYLRAAIASAMKEGK